MKKIFDYPLEGWTAESSWDADELALAFYKIASDVGIKVHRFPSGNPYAVGWNTLLQFGVCSVSFTNQRAGCTLEVVNAYEDKEIDPDILLLWKYFVDKGVVFGELYKRDLTVRGDNATPAPSTAEAEGAETGSDTKTKASSAEIVVTAKPGKKNEYGIPKRKRQQMAKITKGVLDRGGNWDDVQREYSAFQIKDMRKPKTLRVTSVSTLRKALKEFYPDMLTENLSDSV